MKKITKRIFSIGFFLNLLSVIFLLYLPYYIFNGKLYLGGDDTRIFYSYPLEFFRNITFFSWYKVSSIGINGPSQYLAPFLLVDGIFSIFVSSKVILNYLAFSIPLIIGLIYFQKAVKELFALEKYHTLEVYLGALFYIFSPILIINQMFVFLISIWLIGLIPLVGYYLLRYLNTSKFKYVYIASLWCLILSFALYGIPWWSGFVLPIILGFIPVGLLYDKREIMSFLKKIIIFFGFIVMSQAFWLTGFIATYLNLGQNSFASKFLSKGFVDTFTPTINATATSSVIYPLLNLFHRQIAFDFNWKLKDVFLSFYDRTFIFGVIYLLILGCGIFLFKKYLKTNQRRTFLGLLTSFLLSLYFFTVNIGLLKDLFLLFRYIPGFTMYRNFYDKFAPGYVILYAILITVSLIMVIKAFPKKRFLILTIFFSVTILNFFPVKDIVNSPLWTTQNILKTIIIPQEYLDTMNYLKDNISPSNNILSIPFGTSVYTVIKDDTSNNVYVGVSPVKIFSGVNDISGHLSFNYTDTANIVDGLIVNRDYSALKKLLFDNNIDYLLITKNIPQQVLNSWVFSKNMLAVQDQEFLTALTGKKLFVSSKGNYELYQIKEMNSLINSRNLSFQYISPVKYRIYIHNLTKPQKLFFIDSFHPGWKLYLQTNPSASFCKNPVKNPKTQVIECKARFNLFQPGDIGYVWRKPIFANAHAIVNDYSNKWVIDPKVIKNNFGNQFYTQNKDGSIDAEFVLYFQPQVNFYIGTVITFITIFSGGLYLSLNLFRRKTKR